MMCAHKLLLLGQISVVFFSPARAQAKADFHDDQVISKIAFGSCFNPRSKENAIFEGILLNRPEVFVFLGDNIYGDTLDMSVLQKKYAELEAIEGFRKLRASTRMLATWDDHDFGTNDGGKSYPKREESRRIFLDFFQEPTDSPKRKRDGVYGSYTFGKEGKTCQILVLDTRYSRDELPRVKGEKKPGTVGWYQPTNDTTKTLLGEEQWKWLEAQLQVPANIRIIASSIQVIAAEKGMENWGNVPHERKRLFDLLKKHKADHTFAISGDVHFTEISKMDAGGYPFYDFTSSGMSHTSQPWAQASNSFRIGKSLWEKNAGLIEIDWVASKVELSAINPAGKKILKQALNLSELTFR